MGPIRSVREAPSRSLPLLPPKRCPDEPPQSHPECLSSRTHRLRVYSWRQSEQAGQEKVTMEGRFIKERTVETEGTGGLTGKDEEVGAEGAKGQ